MKCNECGSGLIKKDYVYCPNCTDQFGTPHILAPVVGSKIGDDHVCPACLCPDIIINDNGKTYSCKSCMHRFYINVDNEIKFPFNMVFPTRDKNEFYRVPPYKEIVEIVLDVERWTSHGSLH